MPADQQSDSKRSDNNFAQIAFSAPICRPQKARQSKTLLHGNTYGAIAFTLIPVFSSSLAAALVIPITACLLAQ